MLCCSAPQFGVNRRIIAFTDVILEKGKMKPLPLNSSLGVRWYVYINPKITAKSEGKSENEESSASIPFLVGRVERPGLIFGLIL